MPFNLLFNEPSKKSKETKLELIDMIEDYLLLDRGAYREKYRDVEFESRTLNDDEQTAVNNLRNFKDGRKGFWDLPFLNDYKFYQTTKQTKKMLLKEKAERKD